MKTTAGNDRIDPEKNIERSEIDSNKINQTNTHSNEKKFEHDNNKYNPEKAKSAETIQNKKVSLIRNL